MRRSIAICAVVLAAIGFICLAVGSSKADDCEDIFQKGRMRTVRILGEARPDDFPVFDVTVRYPVRDAAPFDPAPKRDMLEEADGVNLLLRNVNGLPSKINVLLHDRRPMSEVVPITVAVMWLDDPSRPVGRIEPYTKPAAFGLRKLGAGKSFWEIYDVYIAGTEGQWTDLITCRTIATVPFPHCAHIFDYKNLDIKILYPVEDLMHWRQLRQYILRICRRGKSLSSIFEQVI